MNTPAPFRLLTCAALLASAATAPAALTLSGLTMYSSDSSGSFSGGAYWDQIAGGGYNLYLFTGSTASPVFLNGGNDANVAPSLSLSPGTYTIRFAGDSAQGAFLGLNLFFDGDNANNRITAFAGNQAEGTYFVVAGDLVTYGQGENVVSSGSLSYTSGGLTVTLSDLRFDQPFPDMVAPDNNVPNFSSDTGGSFTLTVVPEPSAALLGIAGALLICTRRRVTKA